MASLKESEDAQLLFKSLSDVIASLRQVGTDVDIPAGGCSAAEAANAGSTADVMEEGNVVSMFSAARSESAEPNEGGGDDALEVVNANTL